MSSGIRGASEETALASSPSVESGRLKVWIAASVAATALGIRLAHAGSDRFVGTFGDDFFYYLKIASHIVAGHGSTFDGQTPTNGYHPLWMVCIIGLVRLLGTSLPLFVVVATVLSVGCGLVFGLSQSVFSSLARSRGPLSYVVGAYVAIYYYKVVGDGMEVILTIPLLLFLVHWRLRAEARSGSLLPPLSAGLVAAIAVLSRLDSVLFVALFTLAIVLSARLAPLALLRYGALFLVGSLPIVFYVAFNYSVFGELLPVSGAAKQLKELPFTSLRIPEIYRYGRVFDALMFYPSLLATAAAALVAFGRLRARPVEMIQGALPALLFPWLFYLAQMSVSDWPLWCWYLYPLVVSFPIALGVLGGLLPLASLDNRVHGALLRFGKWPAWIALAAVPLVASLVARRSPQAPTPIYSFAKVLSQFAATHPGRYAMGDRAGAVGLVLSDPLLQLEGLVEDRRFIGNIRARRNLRDVLREYGVNYYVSSAPTKQGACYRTAEPAKAGPSSPKMLGEFCEEPAFSYLNESDGTLNVVFKVAD